MLNLYLTPKGLNNNIIYTQLYIPLTYLSKEDPDVLMFSHSAFSGYTNDNKVKVHYYNTLKEKVKFIISNKRNIKNIYTRSIFEFILLYFLRLISFSTYKIRYDFRGLISAESFLRNKSIFRRNLLLILEKFAYKNADSISTVSNKFKEYLHHLNKDNKPVIVTPCCTNSLQLKESTSNGAIKFVYVGSLGKWQNFDEMLFCYKNLSHQLGVKTSLTIITGDKENATFKVNQEKVIADIITVNNSEINNILPQFDFGFLLRDDILLNNVASPVKLLEYTSNGVIPIISNGVGDYSDLIKEKRLGIVVDREQKILLNDLVDLQKNKDIYKKLYDFSKEYTWGKFYVNFRM